MTEDPQRVCSVCVMDGRIAPLAFDANGQCDCCRAAIARERDEYFPNAEGNRRMLTLVKQLRQQGRGQRYDAMIGLSGGIDSAYLAHVLRTRFDLRLLAVHVDGGWNSEAAVHNIEHLVSALGIDLHTHVIEWEEMRDLQLAFLRAGVLNQDIPQDHAFFASLYRLAPAFGIRTFLSGVNFSTESVSQSGGGYPSIDGRHLRVIYRCFGTTALRDYPILTVPRYLWLTRIQRKLTIERPLNWLPYDKTEARADLQRYYGWKEYGTKHSESRFTKFYQEIYLPEKTGFDKRRLHLSALIVSRQITRTEAMVELATPVLDPRQKKFDIRYVAKKLQITPEELARMIAAPLVPHSTYPGDMWLLRGMHSLRNFWRKLKRGFR